jgi:hypothetical protein
VYAREVDGKTVTLAVSGSLWHRSLVMVDRETGSLWSHILGECKQGPLKGQHVKQIPSVMTDWESWRTSHPDGSVVLLSRTTQSYRREFYAKPERFVLGVVESGKAKAWGLDLLAEKAALNDRVGDKLVLAVFNKASVTARLYERKVRDRVLTFRMKAGRLIDEQMNNTWDPMTGRALAGDLTGDYLTAMPAIISYREVWKKFYPESEILSSR